MLLIGICDDEIEERMRLQTICETYLRENNETYRIIQFKNGETVLEYCMKRQNRKIDLLFLDIEMGGISGIELMEAVLRQAKVGRITFVTRHDEYVYRAFSQKTIGFILKPAPKKNIIDKVNMVLRDKQDDVLLTYKDICGNTVLVSAWNVLYFKGCGACTEINELKTAQGSEKCIVVAKRLGEIEKDLQRHSFLRVHKSYLINLRYMADLGAGITMRETQEMIPVGKTYRRDVREQFSIYTQEQIKKTL